MIFFARGPVNSELCTIPFDSILFITFTAAGGEGAVLSSSSIETRVRRGALKQE